MKATTMVFFMVLPAVDLVDDKTVDLLPNFTKSAIRAFTYLAQPEPVDLIMRGMNNARQTPTESRPLKEAEEYAFRI